MKVTIEIPDYTEGFKAGFDQVKHGQVGEVRRALMEALGVSTLQSVRDYMHGRTPLKVGQVRLVEEVFHMFEITENIWGKGL